jgi:hypothetical protein
MKSTSSPINDTKSFAASKPRIISGTFEPALPDNCQWGLWAADGSLISSGLVGDAQKTTLSVQIPSPYLDGTYKLSVRHNDADTLWNQVTNQSGGLVIIENLEITRPQGFNTDAQPHIETLA